MIKFTKEEISLCKQVAEKHRKEIEFGDWYYYSEHLKGALLQLPFINVVRDREIINRDKSVFPLWTISDCLEFLGKMFQKLRVCSDGNFEIEYWRKNGCYYLYGRTPLEACLKAVLAVLEEKR